MSIYRLKKSSSDTYQKLINLSVAERLLNVLVVKGHHLSLAFGNLTSSIPRIECLRQFAVPRVLSSTNRSEISLRLCQAKTEQV